jgi:hypothetical protein
MEKEIELAIALLKQNGYAVKKLSQKMIDDSKACGNSCFSMSCEQCACQICLFY